MMKKNILLLLCWLTLSTANSYAQCTTEISQNLFQQKLQNIMNMSNSGQQVLRLRSFVDQNCFNSYQVKQMCSIIADDVSRLTIAEKAYHKTVDVENFYEVYDSFINYSMVFRLHDYVVSHRPGAVQNNNHNNNSNDNGNDNNSSDSGEVSNDDSGNSGGGTHHDEYAEYDEIVFPDYHAYTGAKQTNCVVPMNESVFRTKRDNVKSVNGDATRLAALKNIVSNNCLATSHLMKYALLLEDDHSRLELVKHAYGKVFDKDNYVHSNQIFSMHQTQEDFARFVQMKQNNQNNNTRSCIVTTAEMETFKKEIKAKTFPSDMLQDAKQKTSSKRKCITSAQVAELMKLFVHESDKLSYAKYAYAYVKDPNNYHVVKSGLTFSINKKRLQDYINSHK